MQLHLVLGPHGVGKSTRVGMFVEWLQTREEPQEYPLNFGKEVGGWLFPQQNLVILGHPVVFQGVSRWKGADDTVTRAGSTEAFLDYVGSILEAGHHVLMEGCPLFTSSQFFPEGLHARFGKQHTLHYQYITYRANREEDYIARVNERNGRGPKEGGGGWGRQAQFVTAIQKVGQQMPPRDAKQTGQQDTIFTWDFQDPYTVVGNTILYWMWDHLKGLGGYFALSNDFHTFCANPPVPVEAKNVTRASRSLLDD